MGCGSSRSVPVSFEVRESGYVQTQPTCEDSNLAAHDSALKVTPDRSACTSASHVQRQIDTQSAHESCKSDIHADVNVADKNGKRDAQVVAALVSNTAETRELAPSYEERKRSFCDENNGTRITSTAIVRTDENGMEQDDESVKRARHETKSTPEDQVEDGKILVSTNASGKHWMVDDMDDCEGSIDQGMSHNLGSRDPFQFSANTSEKKVDNQEHMEQERESQNSQLSSRRLLHRGSDSGSALQAMKETPNHTAIPYFCENGSANKLSDNSKSTTDKNQETAELSTSVIEDAISTTSTSTESAKPEETANKSVKCFHSQLVVSPKIKELQKVLGFISEDSTEMDGTPLNPFDKRAAKDVNKLGLLKNSPIGSHSSSLHVD